LGEGTEGRNQKRTIKKPYGESVVLYKKRGRRAHSGCDQMGRRNGLLDGIMQSVEPSKQKEENKKEESRKEVM